MSVLCQPTQPPEKLRCCASEAACETEGLVQQLGQEFDKTLNKICFRAVLWQGMKHVLHRAGPKDHSRA